MIIVTGDVLATPETLDEIHRISWEHVQRSRTEPGCVSHDMHTGPEQPLRVFFFERWDSLDALKAHFVVPASREFGRRLGKLAAEPPSMTVYAAEVVKA